MKIFHGWRVAGAGAGLQFMQAGLNHQSFGAYIAVLAAEQGWSKTALSGAAALQSVETAVIGPALGWLVDRFGPGIMIRIGVVLFALGLVAFSQVETLTGFYLASLLIAAGVSLCGYFPINVAIIHWFERKRARAMATSSLGLALGGLIVPMVAGSIAAFGWRATALGSAVAVLLLGWPLASVFKGKPSELGQTIDGEPAPGAKDGREASLTPVSGAALQSESERNPSGVQNSAASPSMAPIPAPAAAVEFSLREALRTRAFWLLALGHGSALLVVTSVNVHAISHMKEGLGYSLAQASFIISLMTVGQLGGVGIGMWVGDRYNKRMMAAACMLMHAAGLLLLTWAANTAMLVGFALVHGVAWGLRGPFMQAIRADYFGRRAIGMIMGISSLVIAIGQISGPLVAGAMADWTGDYRAGFTLLALLAGAGGMFFVMATPPKPPLRPA
ncbi:MAG: MFS transporter [Burkholderiaceae bacterium]